MILTIQDVAGNIEKIKVPHRSGDVFGSTTYPIVRGYGGTVARAWAAGASISLRWNKTTAEEMAQEAADGAFADHITAPDPHPQYATDSDFAAHLAATDPHPQYATDAEVAAKLPLAGGVMTGDLQMGAGTKIVFEGATDDDYEVTINPGNPTADRVITLPNKSVTVAGTDAKQVFTAQQVPMNGVLTDAATVAWDGDVHGQVVSLTLGGNRAMGAPTNVQPNASYILKIKQDAVGSRLLSFNTAFKFGSIGAPALTTGANKTDVLSFIGNDDGALVFLGVKKDAI